MKSRVLVTLLLMGTVFKNVSAQPRVFNGVKADIQTYPFMAQVTSLTSTIQCGGTIISQSYVLTAAHCIGTNMVVSVNSTIWNGYDSIKYYVQQVIIHENFDAQMLQNDIAVLKIYGNFIFTKRVMPVKLATYEDSQEIIQGAIGLKVGWGNTGGFLSDKYMNIITKMECEGKFPYYPNEICTKLAGDEANIIATGCTGDAGGPLLLMRCKYSQGRAADQESRGAHKVVIVKPIPCEGGQKYPATWPPRKGVYISPMACKNGHAIVMYPSYCKPGYFNPIIVPCRNKQAVIVFPGVPELDPPHVRPPVMPVPWPIFTTPRPTQGPPEFSQYLCSYVQVGIISIHFTEFCVDPKYPYDLYPQISKFRAWIYQKTGV